MKKNSVSDLIFDGQFRSKISRESIHNLKGQDHESVLATCIAYLLKFKRINHLPAEADQPSFLHIRRQSLELYRQHNFPRNSVKLYLKIAVAASILFVFGIGGYLVGKWNLIPEQTYETGVIEFSTPRGQQSELKLPDGTFVALNYDTKLKYHLSQNAGLQEIELEGEAFFQVTKNRSRTFRVITSDMSVNVLGTEFDVRAYRNDHSIETVLLEGSIEIDHVPSQKAAILLKPGEKWNYDKNSQQHQITKVNPQLATLWRNGEYYFDRITLGELAKTLERMYKVDIHFLDTGLEDEVYSGSVYQEDGINKVFGMINLTIPVIVKTEGSEILVKRR
jgi:transmembrane sensor